MEAFDNLHVQWILRASEAEVEKLALEEAGGNLDEPPRPYEPTDEERDKYAHSAFEPLTMLVAVFAVTFLAERLSQLAKDQKHSGLVIDLRAKRTRIWEEPALDRGAVYVVGDDGVKQISKPETLNIVAAIKAVLGK